MTETVPDITNNPFSFTPISSATLHLSTSVVEKFKTTDPWSGFGNIVALTEEEADGIGGLTPSLSKGKGEVYDLNGRRVTDSAKGIYIKKGKKNAVKEDS